MNNQVKTPKPLTKEQVQKIKALFEMQERYEQYIHQWAENVRKADLLKSAINRGLLHGDNVYELLFMAVDCIGHLTEDKTFTAEKAIELYSVYEVEYGLEMQLELTNDRLRKLKAVPKKTPNVTMAIEAHKRKIERLNRALKKAREENGFSDGGGI